jgi:inner membrane protein
MSPVIHLMGSWLVAAAVVDNPRDRRLVTVAGILPDVDGVGLVVDVAKALASGDELTFHYYAQYHHLWCHGWPAAIVFTTILTCFARQRWRVAAGCLITFHLHLLCDLLGSRGPSLSDLWPICYGEPVFRHPVWFWRGQWELHGWQNRSIFLVVFALSLVVAVKRGFSCVEVFSQRLNLIFVNVLKKWCARFSRKPHAD